MEQKKKFIINMTFYLLAGGIIWGVCHYILPFMLPFLAAFLIAAFLQPPVRKLCGTSERKKKPLSAAFVTFFYVLLFSMVIFVGAKLLQGSGSLIKAAPALYTEKVVPVIEELSEQLETAAASVDPEIAQRIETGVQEMMQDMGNTISDFSVQFVKILSEGIAGIPGFIVKLVIMVVATFFIAADYDEIIGFCKRHVPEKYRTMMENGRWRRR